MANLLKRWLDFDCDREQLVNDLLRDKELYHCINTKTKSYVYRGLSLNVIPQLNQIISISDYGYSYSHDFDVAWDFAKSSDKSNGRSHKVIFCLNNIKHFDVSELSCMFNLEEEEYDIVDYEKELICLDNGLFKIVDIKMHSDLLSSVYQVYLERI